MAKTDQKSSTSGASRREKLDSFESTNAERETETNYESGLVPLLWLGIPFILVLLYGILT